MVNMQCSASESPVNQRVAFDRHEYTAAGSTECGLADSDPQQLSTGRSP